MTVWGVIFAVLWGYASGRYGKKVRGPTRDIWDIAAVAAFYNMSNRLAAAVEMVPNPEYHAMAR